jgi:hypothetical protein
MSLDSLTLDQLIDELKSAYNEGDDEYVKELLDYLRDKSGISYSYFLKIVQQVGL